MSQRGASGRVRPSGLSAVLFDLDDTLLDHRGAARAALAAWSRAEGIDLDDDELERRWLVLETRHYRRYQSGELTKEEQRRERVRELLPPRRFTDDEADAAFAAYWSAYVEAWRTFPDAISAVRRAHAAGLVVGILTNGDASDQRRKVTATGLASLGVPVFASSDLPAAKPDPRAFTTACAALGVQPGECLMVGDSVDSDVAGSLAAGLPVVLLDRYGTHSGIPVPVVASLDDLDFSRSRPVPAGGQEPAGTPTSKTSMRSASVR